MAEISARVARRVRLDFDASADHIIGRLERLSLVGTLDYERMLAAILVRACGDWRLLDQAIALAEIDWRDVLMGTGLEHEGWERRLDEEFGTTIAR